MKTEDIKEGVITDEMREALRAPFPDEAYKAHPTKTFLTTLKAMYITERLNDVFGVGRWDISHKVAERTDNYILILGTFNAIDYEVTTPSQYGGHTTTGINTEIADGFKSAVTDCISKIASYLEIGIDMFKGNINPPKGGATNKPNDPDLPWLNQFEKGTQNHTKEYLNIIKGIKEGKIKTVVDARKYYKIARPIAAELDKVIKDAN